MKKNNLKLRVLGFCLILPGLLQPLGAWATITKVGNGDDGGDLEKLSPLTEGRITRARARAADKLRALNVAGIPELGSLIPEVEKTELFMASGDLRAKLVSDQGSFHSGMSGNVYARTLAQPYASTRFFPGALELSDDQLIALHVHEGLHRALSEKVRENEAIVSEVTLAITSPSANFDGIKQTVANVVPASSVGSLPAPILPVASNQSVTQVDPYPVPEDAPIHQPSYLGYSFHQYRATESMTFPISRMHTIQSFLYPFGSDRVPFGFGIEAGLLETSSRMLMGPLNLSAKLRVWSSRGFDVGLFAQASLNMLSAEELKNSPWGRDIYSIGISMAKDLPFLYFKNDLSYSGGSTSSQSFGLVSYTYDYGGVVTASIHAGFRAWNLRAGVFGEIYLADNYKVSGGAFNFETGRYRIISAGPEVRWDAKYFSLGVAGRWIVNASQDANFDYLGNLMGPGVAQGSLSASVSVNF